MGKTKKSNGVRYHCFTSERLPEPEYQTIETPTMLRGEYPDAPGFKILRRWQKQFFKVLTNALHLMINAPMGSGKTLLLMVLIYCQLVRRKAWKAIVIVPQNSIGNGYKNSSFMLGNKKVRFQPQQFICGEMGTINSLYGFLQKRTLLGNPDYRVLVCTHQTFNRAFADMKKRLSPSKIKELFGEVILAIDEAHHLSNEELRYGDVIEDQQNMLGQAARFFLDNGFPLFLATATPFRADAAKLIPACHRSKFDGSIQTLAYDKYMRENCKHIKEFKYNFALFDRNYRDAVSDIFQKYGDRKTIIFMPAVMTDHASGPGHELKKKDILAIVQAINPNAAYCEKMHTQFGCRYFEIKSPHGKVLKVVEVVNGSSAEIKARVELIQNNRGEIDVIIALGRCKEGFDYDPLSRVIIVGARHSPVECLQMIGRGLRDYIGKRDLQIFHLLSSQVKTFYASEGQDMREALRSHLIVILIGMLMEEVIFPRSMMIKERPSSKNPSHKATNLWLEYFGENSYNIKKEIMWHLFSTRPVGESRADQWKAVESEAASKIKEEFQKLGMSCPKNLVHDMVLQLKASFGRRSAKDNGLKIDMQTIDMETLEKMVDPYGSMEVHASKMFGCNDLDGLRGKLFPKYKINQFQYMHKLCKFIKKNDRNPSPEGSKEEKELYGFLQTLKNNDELQGQLRESPTIKNFLKSRVSCLTTT